MDDPKTRSTTAVRILGALIIIACTAGITVLIEHRLHEDDAGRGHEDHDHAREHPEHASTAHADPHGDHHDEHSAGRVELSTEGRKNAGIQTAVAAPGKVSITTKLPGEVTLNADKLAHVTPRVSGTVREVKRQLGDLVKKGDVLALLDSKELAEISRELRATAERLKLAEANFKRVERLFEDKIVPEKEHLAAKQALAEAQIERDAAAQTMVAAGSAGAAGGYPLVSPLDGTIIEKHCSVGEVLKDDTRVFVIADLSTVWVEVTVYAKDLARVEVGQHVRIRADGIDEALVGTISFLGATASTEARATKARVVLDSPGVAWRPGLFVTAEVTVEEVEAPVVIDDAAVQTVEGRPVVFVEEGGAFEARPVKLGRFGVRDGAFAVEILEGLAAGEPYVTKNAFILKAELGKSEAGHEH